MCQMYHMYPWKEFVEIVFRLNQLAAMKSESDHIQQLLDEYQNDTSPDDLEEKRQKDQEARQKLRNIVSQQSNEIQLLKATILEIYLIIIKNSGRNNSINAKRGTYAAAYATARSQRARRSLKALINPINPYSIIIPI